MPFTSVLLFTPGRENEEAYRTDKMPMGKIRQEAIRAETGGHPMGRRRAGAPALPCARRSHPPSSGRRRLSGLSSPAGGQRQSVGHPASCPTDEGPVEPALPASGQSHKHAGRHSLLRAGRQRVTGLAPGSWVG